MSGAIPPLPNTPSGLCSVKAQGQLYLLPLSLTFNDKFGKLRNEALMMYLMQFLSISVKEQRKNKKASVRIDLEPLVYGIKLT
jgi:hypothetical protein